MSQLQFVFYCVLSISFLNYLSANTPKLIPLIDHVDLVENLTYPLACTLFSGTEVTFQWSHNGIKLTNSTEVNIESTPKYSFLTFRNIKYSHAGNYECRVTNSLGQFDVIKTRITVKGL